MLFSDEIYTLVIVQFTVSEDMVPVCSPSTHTHSAMDTILNPIKLALRLSGLLSYGILTRRHSVLLWLCVAILCEAGVAFKILDYGYLSRCH